MPNIYNLNTLYYKFRCINRNESNIASEYIWKIEYTTILKKQIEQSIRNCTIICIYSRVLLQYVPALWLSMQIENLCEYHCSLPHKPLFTI